MTSSLSFALTPEQQKAFDLIEALSKKVYETLALSSAAAKQREFCEMAKYVDVDKAAVSLLKSVDDLYSSKPDLKKQEYAQFKQLLPTVLSNDMLSLFDTLGLNGGGYTLDPRPVAKGSKAVGVKATYRDAAGKTYDITFTVTTDTTEPKLIDAQTSVIALVASKQSDYEKRMRDAYSKGLTGYPISALNTQLEQELKFRCP